MDKQISEKKFSDWLESLPLQVTKVVRVGVFKFKAPVWWGDTRKLIAATRIMKLIVVICMCGALYASALTVALNNKNKQWELNTYNEEGEVEWVSDLIKLN
ncbi:hypothetical protein VIBNISOn1_190013 [Vibrio nigripulchritudo SOn1]|uniref:Uncharacterized protein n=1 Tax=Vibrio nigripulchritudo SOn1 TaxID=1238450 RepID=A0AAV2VQ27_9VIBR|nr:hypothetical protein [Vibrio nigripulchritudo]CCO46794.1 hypothetical protein VIBNISOn1_190013 [Vibrio nigripulchritudo SOn1]